jgi:hypothetical protein
MPDSLSCSTVTIPCPTRPIRIEATPTPDDAIILLGVDVNDLLQHHATDLWLL